MKPSWRRYGSYTYSIVSDSSPSAAASVLSPTGPPAYFSTIVRRSSRSSRSSPDARERRQVERERAGGRPLPHHDVQAEVLESRIEDLLGGATQAVDLVHEQDVPRLDRGEDRSHVLPLERRAGDRADADAELLA